MTEIMMAGGSVGFMWLPVYVAEHAGILKRAGLTLSVERLGNIEKVTAAVKSGTTQLVITPPEGALRDSAGGGNLRLVGGIMNQFPLTLLGQPRFKRIEDLKGAKIGVASTTEGPAIAMTEVLARHGLESPGDYEFAVVGVHPARVKAMDEGTIDAAAQPIPWSFAALDAGYSNLGEFTDYIPEIAAYALIADRDWAARSRPTLVAFLGALIQAMRMVYDSVNDPLLIDVMMELTHTDRSYATRAVTDLREREAFARDLEISPAALAKSLELMRKANLADDAVVAAGPAAIDDSYRAEALQALATSTTGMPTEAG